MSVIEEKKALRTFIRKKERTLDPTYKAESSEAICRHLLALDEYKSAKVVFAFAGTEKEIDTSLFMNETIAAGKTLILPRCAAEHAIDLCVVRSMDDLEAGAYGILEPKRAARSSPRRTSTSPSCPACRSTARAAVSVRAAGTMTACCRSSTARRCSSAASSSCRPRCRSRSMICAARCWLRRKGF